MTTAENVIEVRDLAKSYGGIRALDGVSFDVRRGEVLGFLGPNGAGKTTTMKILTCFIAPTAGRARIAGHDTFADPLAVRRALGYLPENAPLYPDMRVSEYLDFVGELRGLGRAARAAAAGRVVDQCGLGAVVDQEIRTLSKGYRQRVGLAAALVHKPEVLILDEPTIGLDPIQVREFRNLIGSLKGKHTVLISSHILTEIEALCDSVIILNEGRVVASGVPDDLRGHVVATYTVECRAHPALVALLPQLVNRLPDVTLDRYEESGEFARFRLSGDKCDPRLEISRLFAQAGIEIRELSRERVTLEDVFVKYTKTAPEPVAQSAAAQEALP